MCVTAPPKLKTYLEYDLSSRPPSLFDDASLRKGTKSSVLKLFESIVEEAEINMNDAVVVIDGDFLFIMFPGRKTVLTDMLFKTIATA